MLYIVTKEPKRNRMYSRNLSTSVVVVEAKSGADAKRKAEAHSHTYFGYDKDYAALRAAPLELNSTYLF